MHSFPSDWESTRNLECWSSTAFIFQSFHAPDVIHLNGRQTMQKDAWVRLQNHYYHHYYYYEHCWHKGNTCPNCTPIHTLWWLLHRKIQRALQYTTSSRFPHSLFSARHKRITNFSYASIVRHQRTTLWAQLVRSSQNFLAFSFSLALNSSDETCFDMFLWIKNTHKVCHDSSSHTHAMW